jgi:hypothetical protein
VQFERTLIIADKGSYVSYLEGCTAPMRDENQLHAAVVELVALDDAAFCRGSFETNSQSAEHLDGPRPPVPEIHSPASHRAWATSSRNPGRHHVGLPGRLRRNPQCMAAAAWEVSVAALLKLCLVMTDHSRCHRLCRRLQL